MRPSAPAGRRTSLPTSAGPRSTAGRGIDGSLRLKLLKIGAQVTVTVRRIRVAVASTCRCAEEFALAHARLCR
jgi:hypothetical protein